MVEGRNRNKKRELVKVKVGLTYFLFILRLIKKVVSSFYRHVALSLWESIRDKIVRTSYEQVPHLKLEVTKVFSGISKIHAENLAPLQEFVSNYLKRVENFNVLQSSYSTQLSSTDKDHQLGEKTSRMKETFTLINQLREEIKPFESELRS